MSSTTDKASTSQHPNVEKAALLDDEGDLTEKFEAALIRIFARFSSSYRKAYPDAHASGSKPSDSIPRPNASDVLTEADLDAFSKETNGVALPQESKDEIKEFLDTNDEGNLTLRGFIEMYHLQSDNDPEETWKDLSKLGFDDNLEYQPQDSEVSAKQDASWTEAKSEAKPAVEKA